VHGNLRLWSLPAYREAAVLTSKVGAKTVLFSPDGTRLLAAQDYSIQFWNLAGTPEKRALTGHEEGVPGIAFSPDGKLLVSVSKDQTLKVWDPTTGHRIGELTSFAGHLQAVAFSADGRMLATGDEAGEVRLWRAETLQVLAVPEHDLGKQIWAVGFSPDGAYFAACGERGLALWRVQQGATDRTPTSPLSAKPVVRHVTTSGDAVALCFSPDSKLLAWGENRISGRKVLHLWDLANAREYPSPQARVGWLIHGLAFYPDSKKLSAVDPEGASTVWDITTKQLAFLLSPKKDLERTLTLSVVALSSDGRWFAASWRRAVTVWDTQTRQPVFTLPEERSMPWSLAWNPTRNLLAVGTSDGSLAIWNIPRIRTQLAELGLDWNDESLLEGSSEPAQDASEPPPVVTDHLFALELFGTAQATLTTSENVSRVNVTALDGITWHARLTQLFDDLQEGATYRVRFRARADAPRQMRLHGQVDESDWHSIGLSEQVALTEEWQAYQYEFRAKDIAASNTIHLILGDRTGTVWIADFTVTKETE
jgi:WD40 repeat protein